MSSSRTLVPFGANTAISPSFAYDPGPRWEEPQSRTNRFLDSFYRLRFQMLGALVFGAVAGLLLAYFTPPTYRAEGQVEFDQAAAASAQKQFAETERDLIQSRSLAQKVAASLHLQHNQRAAAALGTKAGGPKDSAPSDELVDRLRDKVIVDFSGDSRLAKISFDSRDPRVSASIANSYIDNYIESNFQRQYDRNVELRRLLDERLADAKTRLDSSEKALIDYTRAAGLIDPSAGTSSVTGDSAPHSLSSDNLTQLNQSYAQARADRIAAEQRWQ